MDETQYLAGPDVSDAWKTVSGRTITSDEVATTTRVLRGHGLFRDTTRVVYMGLVEPDRGRTLDDGGGPGERILRVMRLDLADGTGVEALVEPAGLRLLEQRSVRDIGGGQVPLVPEESVLIEELVRTDTQWSAAVRRRGYNDLSCLRIAPVTAGRLRDNEQGRRLQRCFTFAQPTPEDLPWAHPVDGLVVVVDVIAGEVLEVQDTVVIAVPQERVLLTEQPSGNGSLRPIEVMQPEGPSFTIDEEGVLSWDRWRLQVAFDQREGVIIRDVSFANHGRRRPILQRASVAEMMVSYGDPAPHRWFQNFFDCGEYLLGTFADLRELGCHCIGAITYLDAVMANAHGDPMVVPKAICIHEEDAGILWKHKEAWTGFDGSRRNRRLVVSLFATIGNYDYGFHWYFSLDGSIALEVKATGVVFTSGLVDTDYPFASEIAPGLGVPHHQHLFCARLDVTIDGPLNTVIEVDALAAQPGPENASGTGLVQRRTPLRSEREAERMADGRKDRRWLIENRSVTNRLGRPVGYTLCPDNAPALLAQPDADVSRRGAFSRAHLWVTAFEPDERWPAGDFVNGHPGGDGLPAWTTRDRSVEDTSIVVWHTFGLTHFPRRRTGRSCRSIRPGSFSGRPGSSTGTPCLTARQSESAMCEPFGTLQDR